MNCPNKAHPDWKALVTKVGLDKAYELYIKNNETIPSQNDFLYPSLNDQEKLENTFQDILLPGFTAYTQTETVNFLTEQVLTEINLNEEITFNQAFSNAINQVEGLAEYGVSEDKISPIVENTDKFRDFVKTRLERLGLFSVRKVSEDEAVQIDADQVSDSFYWEDNWVFKFDAKANAQKKIKEFLTFIPKTVVNNEGVYSEQFNYLNTVSYMPLDEVYEDLASVLAGTPNTWQDMRTRLESYIEAKPWIYNLLFQIDNYQDIKDDSGKVIIKRDKQQLLNQFVVTFSLEKSSSKTLLWSDDKGQFSAKVIDTDQNANTKLIISSWKDNFNNVGLLNVNVEGEITPDIEAVTKVIETLDTAKTDKTKLVPMLNSIGIQLSEGTIKDLIEGKIGGKTYSQHFEHNEGIFRLIRQRLTGKDKKGLEPEEVINPMINNKGVRQLAATEELYSNKVYSNSYINGEGNTVYAYTLGKYLTNEYNRIVNNPSFVDRLATLSFQAPIIDAGHPIYKSWIWQLQNDAENFKNIFEVSPFDSIKQEEKRSSAVRINKMYDIDLELTKLQLFQNKGRSVKGTRISNYLFTVPAKTTSYVITAPTIDVTISKGGELGKIAKDAIYSTVLSELKRINSSFNNSAITLTKYKTGSKYFYFFPVLNKETTPEIWNLDGTVKLPTTKVGDTTVEAIIRSKIEGIVKKEIADKVKYWQEIGFTKNGELSYSDKDYKKGKAVNEMAADYIINNMMFEFNMHQMFIGDPAIYFKSNINSTWDQVAKRLAGQIAPGKALALNSLNEKFLSIKVKDREGNLALNYAELKTRLGEKADAYLNLTGTDAQEYVTLREKLYVLYRSGEMSTEMYEDLLNRYEKEGDNLVLSERELDGVFKPDKPVYVENEIDSTQDVLSIDYVKSSSIPLLPQFTKGLELDKIRRAMEKVETPETPARLAFDSATKVGTIKSVNIWNEDGTVKEDIDFSGSYKTLSRTGFRLQQDVPYDPSYDEVVKSTQVTKLLFDSLLGVKDFIFEGKSYTGEELQKKWIALHANLFQKSKDDLNQEILSPDGNLNIQAIQKLLYKEANLRNYSPAEIAALSLLPDNTFEYPFWAVTGSKKYESIITSLYTNNIVKQKMHGGSYVLVSEEATQGRSKGVVYTSAYEGKLKPMRIEDGVVKGAQVLMPWRFKAKLKNYVKDGIIDSSKLPQELLESFGFRIPNQSHSSMSLIEVVGFTPESMGDIVIAPRNLVTQMGSDFDVDKLYLYNYFTKEVDGVLTKDDSDEFNQLKNSLLDIHKAVVKNEGVFNSVVTPLGNIKDTPSSINLKKLYSRNIPNYLSPDYKKQKYAESVDGKAMVSVEALGNTLNTTLQKPDKDDKPLHLLDKEGNRDYITFGVITSSGKVRKLTLGNLSTPFTWKKNKKNDIKAQYLSGAVDNENDPILYYINLNDITAPVELALTQVGFEDDHINNFIAQPIVREFVQQVRSRRSSVGTKGKDIDQMVLSTMINNLRDAYYTSLPEELQRQYKDEILIDNPLTVEQLVKNLTDRDSAKDLEILLKFRHIYSFGKSLQTIQGAINIESSGIGKSVLELNRKVANISKLLKVSNISNVSTLLGEFGENGLEPNTYSGHLIKQSILEADNVLGDNDLFKYNSKAFTKVVNEFESIIGDNATNDQIEDLWSALKSYQFAKQFATEERKTIFFGKDSLARRIKRYLDKEGKTNPFLIRLNFRTNPGSTKPDLISYAAAKEEYIDEISVYQGLVDLLINPDEATRKIGEDLVTYFYINGGIQKAREWGKYIHPNYLKTYKEGKFLQALKDINFSDESIIGSQEEVSDFVLQYFQHNPFLAPKLSTDEGKKVGQKLYVGYEDGSHPIVMFDKFLYVKENVIETGEDAGTQVYSPINILGGTSYLEYSKDSRALSLTNHNFNKAVISAAPSKNLPVNDTKTITTENFSHLEGDLSSVLDSIKSPKWDALKQVIKEAGVKVKVNVDTSIPVAGRYNGDTQEITLNPAESGDIEKTLMHEAVHAVTVKALESVDGLTPSQVTAVNNLKTIHNTIVEGIKAGKFEDIGWSTAEYSEFVSLYNTFKKETLTETQEKRLKELRPKYYGLINPKEFLSEMFTQDTFKEQLNKAKYDGSKSFLDRIWDLIEKLFKGYQVNSGSSLEAGLHNALTLITEKKPVAKKSIFDTSRGAPPIFEASISDTIKPEYRKLVSEISSRIRKIDESISKAYTEGDKVRAQELKNRKAEVEDELKELEESQVFATVLNLAEKDLANVEKLFEKGAVSHNDINYTLRVIKTWLEARELVLEPNDIKTRNQRYKDIKAIETKASELYDQWNYISRTALLDAVKKSTGMIELTEEVLNAQDKVNALTANLMDISRTGNIVLSVMDKWMREASYKANLEAQEIHKETEHLVEQLHKNALFKKDGYYTFAQTTKDGELTGDVVRALTAEYYDTRNRFRDNYLQESNKSIRADKRSQYFKWLRENHTVIDIRKLYKETEEGTYKPIQNTEYSEQLKREFGEDYETLIEEQTKKIEYYNESLNLQTEATKDDPDGFRKVEEWKMRNNPAVYLRNFLDNNFTINKIGDKFIENSGYDYVLKRAHKKWEDGKYNSIQKSPELKAFYDHTLKTLNRLYSYIPSIYKEEITTATIPNMAKTVFETFAEKGMTAAMAQANNERVEAVSVDDSEKRSVKVQDPLTNKPEQVLKVKYLSKLNPNEKSYDLGKVLNAFAIEALTYKHKSVVEDSIRLSYSILEQSLESVKTPTGRNMLDRFGNTLKIKDGRNLLDQVEYAIDAFYGNRKAVQGVTNKKVYTNKAKTKTASIKKAIETNSYSQEVIKLIDQELNLPSIASLLKNKVKLSDEAKDSLKTATDAYLNKNTRYVSGGKIGDVVLKYMQLKGMGWNVFSSTTNVVYGWFANMMHSSGGKDFTTEQLMKANSIMLSATGKSLGANNSTAKKLNALMAKFDVIKELNEAAYKSTTNSNSVRKGMEKLSPFELQRRGEYFVQGMTMVASMLNTKVIVDGKETNLWEAFDQSGEYKGDDKADWTWRGDKESGKKLFDFKFKLDQVNKTIHGNYDPNSPVRIKKGVLGRATMQFRSWIAEGVASRLEGEKFDLLLNRKRKGRWVTYGDLGFKDSLKALLRVAAGKDINELTGDQDLEIVTENMKRNLMEIYQSLSLMAMYFLLKGLDTDDDDEWNKAARNFALNQILRLQDDIEFYYSPIAAENITQNFVPVFTLIRDSDNFRQAVSKGIFDGEWEYKTGKKAGENRLLWTGTKLFPFGSSMAAFLNKTENEENFRK